MRLCLIVLCSTAAILLGACGERAQTASHRKSDTKPWDGAQSAYAAPGWKTGDQTAWEEQLRKRSQGQNDYVR